MFLYDKDGNVSSDAIVPVNADTLALVEAMDAVRSAKKALKKAIADVPVYTAQYDPKDYYADEQNEYNIAVNAFGEVLRDFIWKTSPNSR